VAPGSEACPGRTGSTLTPLRLALTSVLVCGLCACPGDSPRSQGTASETPGSETPISDALGSETPGSDAAQAQVDLEGEALARAILATPYSALVQIESAESIEVPDEDPQDDYSEVKQLYRARVLENYRGEPASQITYVMFVEEGEELDGTSEPFILTLCSSEDGLYWPGVGASFSGTDRLRERARELARASDPEQTSFDDCD